MTISILANAFLVSRQLGPKKRSKIRNGLICYYIDIKVTAHLLAGWYLIGQEFREGQSVKLLSPSEFSDIIKYCKLSS